MAGRAEGVAAAIRERIGSGELRPGDRVPSTRRIVDEFGVAMATASRALGALRAEGLVRAVPGVGTVVAEAAGPSEGEGAASAADAASPAVAAAAVGASGASGSSGASEAHAETAAGPGRAAPSAGAAAAPGSTAAPASLSLPRIVRTAVALADAEGLRALSMRRVAAELGVATMSLYRYVGGKDELLVQMADTVFGEIAPEADPPDDWRAAVEAVARLQWEGCRAHPWLAHVQLVTRPMPTRNGMRITDWAMRAVDGLGLTDEETALVAVGVATFVRGFAMDFEAEAQAQRDTGLSKEDWMTEQEPVFQALLAESDLTAMPRMMVVDDEVLTPDGFFEFSLARMLDGLGVLIEGAAGRTG